MNSQVRRQPITPVVAVMLLISAAGVSAAHLSREAAAGWTVYVAATQRRIAHELESSSTFLAMDFGPEAATDRRAVLSGTVVVRAMETADARGRTIDVPSGRVHHWRGGIFIPGITVHDLVSRLKETAPPPDEDVLASRVLGRGPDWMKVYLKLQRTKLVTVVYNTEHVVTFARHGATRATSTSTATRIAEVSKPNTTHEQEQPVGDDSGFLWRLTTFWRYEGVPGGVIAECESLSLSRDVPSVLRPFVDPLIDGTARESMTRTLSALKRRFGRAS